MAEAGAEASSLASNIKCGVCFKLCEEPKDLPCRHAFCCECLVDWGKTGSKDQSVVSCPLCRKVYRIPVEGVKGFPEHFLVTDNVERKEKSTIQYCENHAGQIKQYFCENCSSTTCSDCGLLDPAHKGHRFIRLKEAAERQTDSLQSLFKHRKDAESKYKVAIQEAEQIQTNLERAANTANDVVESQKNWFIQQLEDLAKSHKKDVCRQKEEIARQIEHLKDKLQVELATVTSAIEEGTEIVNSGSEYEITSIYPSLSAKLQQLIKLQPIVADGKLGDFTFEPREVKITSIGQISDVGIQAPFRTANLASSRLPDITSVTPNDNQSRIKRSVQADCELIDSTHSHTVATPLKEIAKRQWKYLGEIKLGKKLIIPQGITVDPNGDIVVTSRMSPVRVLSPIGDLKCVFKHSPVDAVDITISQSAQYIFTSKKGFHIYNGQGICLSTTRTYDVNNRPSRPCSVAVDSRGRIIVGLGYTKRNKTVSIHQPDGELISKFATPECPRRIICTPDDELVISFADRTLQIIDQSGDNARVIRSPPDIKLWDPWYVCCSKQGELFVGNQGTPKAIYRYVSTSGKYNYTDCITRMTEHPWGIALSANEDRLFVVSSFDQSIKIFQC